MCRGVRPCLRDPHRVLLFVRYVPDPPVTLARTFRASSQGKTEGAGFLRRPARRGQLSCPKLTLDDGLHAAPIGFPTQLLHQGAHDLAEVAGS